MIKLSATKKLILGAMVTALSVLCVYAAGILPTLRVASYFLSSLFVYVLVSENAYGSAIIAFVASCAVSFFLLPDKLAILPYALLVGHYGIFKTLIDRKVKDKFVKLSVKLIYCNAFLLAGLFLIAFVFEIRLDAISALPIWLLVLIAEALLVLFDLLYTFCQHFYDTKLRRSMVTRR